MAQLALRALDRVDVAHPAPVPEHDADRRDQEQHTRDDDQAASPELAQPDRGGAVEQQQRKRDGEDQLDDAAAGHRTGRRRLERMMKADPSVTPRDAMVRDSSFTRPPPNFT